jgi:predicted transcriptional regulator
VGRVKDACAVGPMSFEATRSFLAAVQLLPGRQRAALILRDVLGFSAGEVAGLLETTSASVNSALQRAHTTLERRRAEGRLRAHLERRADEVEDSLVRRYVVAWEAVDVERLVALLREDAVMTMPPFPLLYRGRKAIADCFSTIPAGGALDHIRLVLTGANRDPALAG